MPNSPIIENISQALAQRIHPTVTVWNRLEGRPRRADFDRALKAEIRDPLWMICKQWQMGEFEGDDAGSPVVAKALLHSQKLSEYRLGAMGQNTPEDMDYSLPLEARVEQQPLPLTRNGQPFSLDLRLLMGRHWMKLLTANQAQVGNVRPAFLALERYEIKAPDLSQKADAEIIAHPEVYQTYKAVAGRSLDGGALYLYLKADPLHKASDDLAPAPTPAQATAIDELGKQFVAWVDHLFQQPGEGKGQAWLPDRLEYQFGCASPIEGGEKAYEAEEYYQGRLDWYSFHIDEESTGWDTQAAAPHTDVKSFVPTQLSFEGMPHPRWWTFEDNKTYFGDVNPSTTDLAKLLFMEFGLVYGNDWFVIPYEVDVEKGAVVTLKGLTVTNVFGERIWVEAAGKGQDDDWQRWSMFTVSRKGQDLSMADNSLLMLPTVPKVQEGKPLDEIYFVRDEVANMVWGLEQRIPLPDGSSKPGAEAATETRQLYERLLDEAIEGGLTPAEVEWKAPIRYEVVNRVPENWIPMIPVHMPSNNREIQLRRAAMPRTLDGDPDTPERVRPRTILLRQGLEDTPRKPYFLHEEEVPRAGTRVSQAYQRTRWDGGRVVTWLGVRKRAGRGEGSSGLAFDRIVDTRGRRRG